MEKEELTFEEHINRIFERAHIPEFAHDAKFPIIQLHKRIVEDIVKFISYDLKLDNEEQRKTVVEMYLEDFKENGKL